MVTSTAPTARFFIDVVPDARDAFLFTWGVTIGDELNTKAPLGRRIFDREIAIAKAWGDLADSCEAEALRRGEAAYGLPAYSADDEVLAALAYTIETIS